MTKFHNPLIIVCPVCDTEYVGDPSTPCPLCPLGQTAVAAVMECANVQAYLVITSAFDGAFEVELNEAIAGGWHLDRFLAGPTQEEHRPVLVALLSRPDYDRDRHVEALEAKRQANATFDQERDRVEAEVQAFKAQVTARPFNS